MLDAFSRSKLRSVWAGSVNCLQEELDSELLKLAACPLAGQPLLVGGARERSANEIVSFGVWRELPIGNGRSLTSGQGRRRSWRWSTS